MACSCACSSGRRLTLTLIAVLVLAVLSLFPLLGGQFLPKLEEGNIWAHATMPQTVSLDQGAKLVSRMRQVFMSFPEVTTVVSQLGRPDDGTETTGFYSIEFSVDLRPDSQWPSGIDKAELVKEIDAETAPAIPGRRFRLLTEHRG